MNDKLIILKDKIIEMRQTVVNTLEEVKKVPDHKRQESTLLLRAGELCALDIVLNMIKELE